MKMATMGFESIKNQISELKGKNINLEVNIGRKKLRQFKGKIESIYPSVFTFFDEDENIIKTYSYTDVLCGDVKFL